MEQFDLKTCVKNFIKLDDDISLLNKKIKELKQNKQIYMEKLLEYLKKKSEEEELSDPSIKYETSIFKIVKTKPKRKVNKNTITEILETKLENNIDKTKEILDEIFTEEPDCDEIIKLKRIKKIEK